MTADRQPPPLDPPPPTLTERLEAAELLLSEIIADPGLGDGAVLEDVRRVLADARLALTPPETA